MLKGRLPPSILDNPSPHQSQPEVPEWREKTSHQVSGRKDLCLSSRDKEIPPRAQTWSEPSKLRENLGLTPG